MCEKPGHIVIASNIDLVSRETLANKIIIIYIHYDTSKYVQKTFPKLRNSKKAILSGLVFHLKR